MSETLAYKPTEKRGETFSYLPPMTPDRLRKQIAYLWIWKGG
jgi:ribulose-bisphosphate carboxylase small chain